MRMRFAVLLTLVLGSVLGAAPDPTVPIEFPPTPVPAPQPVPTGSATKLSYGQVYDVRCTIPCDVSAYPAGFVTITKIVVPVGETLRDRNNFTDGAKTHVYRGPVDVYHVESLKTGPITLVVTPEGKKSSDIQRRLLDVDAGTGPQPPPKPDDPPIPDPKPKPVPVTSFRVILIYESAELLTPAQRGVVYGKVVEDWLTANCTGGKQGWRRRDKDAPGDADATMAALWNAIKPNLTTTPCIAIEVNGKVDIISLEATPAKMVEILNTYRGK